MKNLLILSLVLAATGCTMLPFEAGHLKEERPYPEGEWFGPVSVASAEKDVYEASAGRRNRTGWLNYDVRAEWEKLKTRIQRDDEIWEFRMSPLVVDGGDRYFGFSLVRKNKIVACVVTQVIEEHAP